MRGDLRDVIEIKADNQRGDSTYRAAYTIKLGDTVYVLHVFQKKSKKGRETPQRELDLIRLRLTLAREHHEQQERKTRN
ncbi:MAG: type II toxin-antitoxin system RelE/ParE family toxin [Vulcanimicrobiaceae bacterium]|jgi:phage-related protein